MDPLPICVQVPEAAHRYWPEGSDLLTGTGKEAIRYVFEEQRYTMEEEAEIDAIEALIKEDESIREQLPSGWSRSSVLRLLYAANWDHSLFLDLAHTYISWCQTKEEQRSAMQETALPVLVSPIQRAGGLYLYGRDHRFRPVVVAALGKILEVGLCSFAFRRWWLRSSICLIS